MGLCVICGVSGFGREVLPDADWFTPFSRLSRATSFEELPELWNVLKDDMRLVGLRPLLMEYLLLYSPEQASRHKVRPGLTGWAQVDGRNSLGWDEKLKLDVWYVDNISLGLDMRIFVAAVILVIKRDGISPRDQEIMPRFTGSIKERVGDFNDSIGGV